MSSLNEAIRYSNPVYNKLSISDSKEFPGLKEVQTIHAKVACSEAKGCHCRACMSGANVEVHGPTCDCKDCKKKFSAGGPGSGRHAEFMQVAKEHGFSKFNQQRSGDKDTFTSQHPASGHTLSINKGESNWSLHDKSGSRVGSGGMKDSDRFNSLGHFSNKLADHVGSKKMAANRKRKRK